MNASSGIAEGSSPIAANASSLADSYRALIDKAPPERDAFVDERIVRLRSLGDLHFLDWHACLLLARACYTPVFVLREAAPAHLRARVAAYIVRADTGEEGAGSQEANDEVERLHDYFDPARGESLDYAHGVLLERFLDVHRRSHLWHDYLTSRDVTPARLPAGETLAGKFPHLRAGFVTGADLFNRGEFYEAHEDWESLWMRLDAGAERSLAQGLIQLAGAHIHRLKDRLHEAQKLFANSLRRLADAATIDWIDVEQLVEESHRVFAADITAAIPIPSIPLRDTHLHVARKHQ